MPIGFPNGDQYRDYFEASTDGKWTLEVITPDQFMDNSMEHDPTLYQELTGVWDTDPPPLKQDVADKKSVDGIYLGQIPYDGPDMIARDKVIMVPYGRRKPSKPDGSIGDIEQVTDPAEIMKQHPDSEGFTLEGNPYLFIRKPQEPPLVSSNENPLLQKVSDIRRNPINPKPMLESGVGGGTLGSSGPKVTAPPQYYDKAPSMIKDRADWWNKNYGTYPTEQQLIPAVRARIGQIRRDITEFNKTNPGETYAPRQELSDLRKFLRDIAQ